MLMFLELFQNMMGFEMNSFSVSNDELQFQCVDIAKHTEGTLMTESLLIQ